MRASSVALTRTCSGSTTRAQTRALAVSAVALAVVLAGCSSAVDNVTGRANNDWALSMTGAEALADRGLTGNGVTVAVIDTGYEDEHADFRGVAARWADVVNGRQDPYDDAGHGTHVSGLVVAQGNGGFNDPRVVGVAPGATLLHVKGVPGNGEGSGSEVAEAIDIAARQGAHVIVLSLGGDQGLPILGQQVADAVNRAIDRGVVVVAAAGNAAEGETGEQCGVSSPGSVRRVIAVGAIDRQKRIAPFSCTGDNDGGPLGIGAAQDPHKKPELVAPGVELVGPWPGRSCGGQASQYCSLSGTSQAAPLVGGIVALLLEAHPELKRQDGQTVVRIKQALVNAAEELPGMSGGHDDRYGYGLVRGDRAVDNL